MLNLLNFIFNRDILNFLTNEDFVSLILLESLKLSLKLI